MAVPISSLLRHKDGASLITLSGDATISDAARTLTEHNIGAVVVTADDGALAGILSERDIVRGVAEHGPDVLTRPVADVMTVEVTTCASDVGSDEIMTVMTQRRIRHVPVVDDDELVGIVSIGDIVKSRLDQLALQKDALEAYVSGGSY